MATSKKDYRKLIEEYEPTCEQEVIDKKGILAFIDRNPDVLDRTNLVAHLTVSAIVVNEKMDKVLFAFHNIYKSWAWVGGHNDGNPDMLEMALTETKEETGLKKVHPYSDDIFMLDTILVYNHIKRGKYISDHLHLNATFLLIADENDQVESKPDENSGVRWFPINEVLDNVSEPRMKAVYMKAFSKIENVKVRENK